MFRIPAAVMAFTIVASTAFAGPFVASRPVVDDDPAPKTRKTRSYQAPGPAVEIPPPPAIPAATMPLPPLTNTPSIVPGIPAAPAEKKPEPEDRYTVEGIVNDKIVLIDHELDDRTLHVNDLSLLDNGCVVKFPKVVCGKPAKAIIAAKIANNELAEKYETLAKEKSLIYRENEKLTARVTELETTIKTLTPEAEKGKNADYYFAEMQKAKEALKSQEEWQTEVRKAKTAQTEAMTDLSELISMVITTKSGTEYNVPGFGRFRALEGGNTMFAFVPADTREKAEKYFGSTIRRGYADKTGVVIYILDRDQISTAGTDKTTPPAKQGK